MTRRFAIVEASRFGSPTKRWLVGRRNPEPRRGQLHYSDLAIETALTLRAVFRLALRQSEGLIGSIMRMLEIDLPVPDHTTLSLSGLRQAASVSASHGPAVTCAYEASAACVASLAPTSAPARSRIAWPNETPCLRAIRSNSA